MFKRKKILKNSLVTLYFILSLVLGGCTNEPRLNDTEGLIKNDSIRVTLNDLTQSFSREKQLFNYKADWEKLFADTQKLKVKAFEELIKTFNASETYYGKIISNKNEVIFSSNRKLIQANTNHPHIWVLIAIVLGTGILGGLAGPRFSLLDDKTEKAVKEAKDKIVESKRQTDMLKETLNNTAGLQENAGLQDVISGYENANQKLEAAADDLEKEAERKYAFVLFGIIAAALSFVALNLFNSKILDFKTEIDYFIFAGYCVLGAVFAKKYIVQLYDAITKKQ